MVKTVVGTLAAFFNVGDGKRSISDFQQELKALTDAEKLELATLAAAEMGITLKV